MDKDEELTSPKTKNTLNVQSVRSSSRPKVPMDKMREYHRQLFEGDFEAAQKACTKQVSRIQSLLSDQNETYEIYVLQMERGKLEAHMEDFTSAHKVLYNIFEIEEEKIQQNTCYDTLNSHCCETFRSLREKICSLQLQMDDRQWTHSTGKQSRCSGCSKRSSVLSSSLERKAEMAAKAARLGAELKFLDAESQSTERLRRQEYDIKKLKMMKELAAMHAELEAVKRVEEENYGTLKEVQSLPTNSCSEDQLQKYLLSQMDSILNVKPSNSPLPLLEDNVPPNSLPSKPLQEDRDPKRFIPVMADEAAHVGPSTSTDFNPFAPPFLPNRPIYSQGQPVSKPKPDKTLNSPEPASMISTHSTGEELLEKLAELLTQRQDKESLPCPEPEVFRGNPLRYPTWIRSFETFIETKTKDPSEWLYYLGCYTAGEAKEAVSGLLSLGSTEAYQKARKILTDRLETNSW